MTLKNINPDLLRLKDMLEAIEDITDIALSAQSPRKDLLATAYSIAIIGEAANRLSPALKSAHSHIPWRDIVSMRHKIIHEYGKIDKALIIEVIRQDIPLLKEQLSSILITL